MPARTKKGISSRTKKIDRVSSGAENILRRVRRKRGGSVIWQGGKPKAVILSIEDYLRLAAPEPEVLRLIRKESVKHGTDRLSMAEIDEVIAEVRRERRKRSGAA
jgi:hypothetical protein